MSIPETQEESFDFVDFLRNNKQTTYTGSWNIYFIKRDLSSDFLGFRDIGTGKLTFNEGVVYELSDDKFIYNLMNFPKHSSYEMTNIFDIQKKNYTMVKGVGNDGGYHAQIFRARLFHPINDNIED